MNNLPPTRYILLTIGLVALAILFSLSDIMQNTIAPFLYLLLLRIATILDALPPLALWILFIVIIFQFSLTSLFSFGAKIMDHANNSVTETHEDQLGPVEKYGRWVSQSGQGQYFSHRVAFHMSNLTRKVIDDDSPRWQWQKKLEDQNSEFDHEVAQFLLKGHEKQSGNTDLRRRLNLTSEKPIYDELNPTLNYLEERLGIK